MRDCYVECSCGKKYTRDEFEALEEVGIQCIPAGSNGNESWEEYELELRNCTCGSTIGVEHFIIKLIEPDPNSESSKMFEFIDEMQRQIYMNMSPGKTVLK